MDIGRALFYVQSEGGWMWSWIRLPETEYECATRIATREMGLVIEARILRNKLFGFYFIFMMRELALACCYCPLRHPKQWLPRVPSAVILCLLLPLTLPMNLHPNILGGHWTWILGDRSPDSISVIALRYVTWLKFHVRILSDRSLEVTCVFLAFRAFSFLSSSRLTASRLRKMRIAAARFYCQHDNAR